VEVFRRHPKARRLDTRRRRFAPVNLRGELYERTAVACDGDELGVPRCAGLFGGVSEIEASVGPSRACRAEWRWRCIQRHAAHHAAAHALADDRYVDGCEEPAGQVVAGFPATVVERDGEVLAMPDQVEDEVDQ